MLIEHFVVVKNDNINSLFTLKSVEYKEITVIKLCHGHTQISTEVSMLTS